MRGKRGSGWWRRRWARGSERVRGVEDAGGMGLGCAASVGGGFEGEEELLGGEAAGEPGKFAAGGEDTVAGEEDGEGVVADGGADGAGGGGAVEGVGDGGVGGGAAVGNGGEGVPHGFLEVGAAGVEGQGESGACAGEVFGELRGRVGEERMGGVLGGGREGVAAVIFPEKGEEVGVGGDEGEGAEGGIEGGGVGGHVARAFLPESFPA